ncbi:MAG: hypothetical protein AAGA55_00110 [Planctomycetota bacterium]
MPDAAQDARVFFKASKHVIGCLILAFAFTVLCAWIPALWASTGTFASLAMSNTNNPTDAAGIWRGRVPAEWGPRPLSTTTIGIGRARPNGVRIVGSRIRYVQGDHLGVSTGAATGPTFSTTGAGRLLDQYEIGWPWKIMMSVGSEDNRPSASAGAARWYDRGIAVPAFEPLGMKPDRTIPVRPIWSAFALMFVSWIMVLALAVLAWKAPSRIRRHRRNRRGLCRECGYNIDGMDGCPECGTPRVSRSTAA